MMNEVMMDMEEQHGLTGIFFASIGCSICIDWPAHARVSLERTALFGHRTTKSIWVLSYAFMGQGMCLVCVFSAFKAYGLWVEAFTGLYDQH